MNDSKAILCSVLQMRCEELTQNGLLFVYIKNDEYNNILIE